MIILAILITFLITISGGYLLLRPRLRQRQELDKQILQENLALHEKNAGLKQTENNLLNKIASAELEELKYKERISILQNNTKVIEEQAQQYYKKSMDTAQEHLEQSLAQEGIKYQNEVKKFQDELAIIMEEGIQQYQDHMCEKRIEMEALDQQVEDLRKIFDAAVTAAKRAEEIKEQNDFYRIQLASWEINEIEMLRETGSRLKNIEPLNKVIWKCYYEKPTTDMIGRVIGSGIHTGIYKITNITNQKCYVGQAIDLANRWKQHIKRGVGADTPTRNKLYPAMYAVGPENFTFEVLEECDNSLLNSREDYWQDFYKAKEFGYSIK